MALAYRASSFVSAGNANGGNLTINKPTGAAAGDLCVYVVYWEPDTNTITTIPTGFTSQIKQVNTGAFMLEVFAKILDGTEGTTFTFGDSAPGNQWRSIVGACYSGGAGSPLTDVSGGSQADGVIATGQTAPSVTTTVADDMLTWGYGNYSGTNPTTMSGTANNLRGALGGTALSDVVIASPSSTGTTYPNAGVGTEDYAAVHVAFKSSVAGASPPYRRRKPQRMFMQKRRF